MNEDAILGLLGELESSGHHASSTFRAVLTAHNCSLLGAGMYGYAVKLPDGRVLKCASWDNTMIWIHAAAEYFRVVGEPATDMPVVWGFGQLHERGRWWAVMEEVHLDLRIKEGGWYPPYLYEAHPEVECRVYATMRRLGIDTDTADTHAWNFGTTADGRVVVFDPASSDEESSEHVLRTVWSTHGVHKYASAPN